MNMPCTLPAVNSAALCEACADLYPSDRKYLNRTAARGRNAVYSQGVSGCEVSVVAGSRKRSTCSSIGRDACSCVSLAFRRLKCQTHTPGPCLRSACTPLLCTHVRSGTTSAGRVRVRLGSEQSFSIGVDAGSLKRNTCSPIGCDACSCVKLWTRTPGPTRCDPCSGILPPASAPY